jgi:organic radical activating enzyme
LPELYRIEKLEYDVTNECNLKCDQCDHLAPFFNGGDTEFNRSINLEEFSRQLMLLAKHLHTNSFWILGGEPLLQKQLLDYLACLRSSGITDKIVLVTNGLMLAQQPDALFHAVDKIMISLYSSTPIPQQSLHKIVRRCETARVELGFFSKSHFRKTIVAKRNDDPHQVGLIFQTCTNAWNWHCHAIHDGHLYRCATAPILGYRLHHEGLVERDFRKDDGLKLEDSPELGDRIREYLSSSIPLESCFYCVGCVGKLVRHRQLSKKEIEEKTWIRSTVANSLDKWKAFRKFSRWRLIGQR